MHLQKKTHTKDMANRKMSAIKRWWDLARKRDLHNRISSGGGEQLRMGFKRGETYRV